MVKDEARSAVQSKGRNSKCADKLDLFAQFRSHDEAQTLLQLNEVTEDKNPMSESGAAFLAWEYGA